MKTTYKSRYTDRPITSAQYLAERICERIAKKEKVELPYRFWNTNKWKRVFLYQVQVANGLLKLYRIEAINAALLRYPQAYSLNAQFLDPTIRAEQDRLELQEKLLQSRGTEVSQAVPLDTTQQPRPAFVDKPTKMSKLKDL